MKHLLFALAFLVIFVGPAFAKQGKVLDVQVVKSKSGVEAWVVEDTTAPVISMTFSFEGGIAYDPEGKPGVGRLVSILLDEGAGKMKAQEFQAKLADNAISLSFTPGRDAFYGRLRTLKKNKDLAFELLRMALSDPRFDEDAITRMKNANIADIKNDMGEPGWLVARSFNGTVFEGHPYAVPGFGHLASMAAITRKDLLTFTKEQFARSALKVSFAGDITANEARDAVDKVFGGLPEKAAPVSIPQAQLKYPGKTVLLPLEAPQTFIITGQRGISRKDKDWHAAMVMNYVLGGGNFTARLMREIREKRGLTYGIYSSLVNMTAADLIQTNMSASNEKVEEALRVLKDEWASMAKDGVTEEELKDAKSYLTGSLLLQLTSTLDIASVLNDIQRDGLGPDYINRRNELLNALTLGDIKRVAAKLLKPEELTTILVGKPKNLDVDILLDKPPGMMEPEAK